VLEWRRLARQGRHLPLAGAEPVARAGQPKL
jgi:hypothetical protein